MLFTTLFIILLTSCEQQAWMEYPIPAKIIIIDDLFFNMNETNSKPLNYYIIPKKNGWYYYCCI